LITITNDLLRKFEDLIKNIDFNVSQFLVFNDISKEQEKIIEKTTEILKDNTVDEIKTFGGNLDKNIDKIEKIKESVKAELEKEENKDAKSDLEKIFDSYIKAFKQLIPKVCGAIIPVKQMPFVDVYFRTVPRISIDKEKPQKVSINESGIAYYGEIKCITPRIILLAKIKGEEPLFAPLIGDLDIGDYKFDDSKQKSPKIQIFPYISALISSMDKEVNKNNVSRYNEQYQRHGEPICDFLLKDKELMDVTKKISSAIESKRTSSNVAVCGIAVPDNQDQSTVIIVQDESGSSSAHEVCFESELRFAAACCEAPSTRLPGQATPAQPAQTQAPGQPGQVIAPSGQRLQSWTAEELAKDAAERGASGGLPPGMDVWTENELQEMAKSRTDGGINLPVWTEEELKKLSKSRQGALNLPEWKQPEDMKECEQCGYALRLGWDSCPICGWKVGTPPAPKTENQEPEEKKEEETPQTEEKLEEEKPEEKAEETERKEEKPEESAKNQEDSPKEKDID
jgi:hypothetical protein